MLLKEKEKKVYSFTVKVKVKVTIVISKIVGVPVEVVVVGVAAIVAVSKVRGGLNPGSTQVRTLGLDQRGGRPNINIKNLGSTQVQPRFNPGSTQV